MRLARAAAAAACTVLGLLDAAAQVRPDAGTLQEAPRLIPTLPPPGGRRVQVPDAAPAAPAGPSSQVVPAGFRFEGNTLIDSATLGALLAASVGQPMDLAALEGAARRVQELYQDRGYLLTHAFVPQQLLPREGGIVLITVVEARIGRVTVDGGNARTTAIAASALPAGAPVTEALLERPVLLLRDLKGYDATATVQPGARTGEVDVHIALRSESRLVETSVGVDNHGLRAAGTLRAFASVEVVNPTGHGDLLSARVQGSEESGNHQLRLAYSVTVNNAGTVGSATLVRARYALGEPFAALGATGEADITTLSVTHPLLRERNRNLFILAAWDDKRLRDALGITGSTSSQHISALRLGVLGNFADTLLGPTAYTSLASSLSFGRVRMDSASAAVDAAPGGTAAAGSYNKATFEFQRTQQVGEQWSVFASAQGQWASRNLVSAEKMTLGGPSGVRAYPAAEAPGASGALVSAELRYHFSMPWGADTFPGALGLFYDWGRVRTNQSADAHRSLAAAGLSLQAARAGNVAFSAALAWRVGSDIPSGGEPARSPRVWLTIQKWL